MCTGSKSPRAITFHTFLFPKEKYPAAATAEWKKNPSTLHMQALKPHDRDSVPRLMFNPTNSRLHENLKIVKPATLQNFSPRYGTVAHRFQARESGCAEKKTDRSEEIAGDRTE